MSDSLSLNNVMAVATRHISTSTRLWPVQRQQAQPVPFTSVAAPVHLKTLPASNSTQRYAGDFQIALPDESALHGNEEGEPEGAAALPPPTREGAAHEEMMRTRVEHLHYVMPELREIALYLSVNDDWTNLAAHMGLSHIEINVYRNLLQTRPGVPSGQTFLESHMSADDFTVGVFLQALLKMSKTYREKAQRFWTAALLNNSPYYLDLRRNRKI
ncbi:hypothetical protein EGW08_006422 [Elysia chlorotica]|uniref:Uncharacterized protein n=1 Tax=Elysia chlorotica TaxID=188477 RepID=A0A433TW40_ELYCH|nr:hypothetical protein EGW08_006422 [Elysia chlorotica]